MANFDLIEYQKRVINDLTAENKALKEQIEVLNNQHIKIQYHNEELTIREICERLERAEKKALDGWNTLDSLYGTSGKYCDDKISEYFHRWI